MKIKMEVDLEASEMRELLGLPDVKDLQSEVLKAVSGRVNAAARTADPLALMKAFVPQGLQSMADWQALWQRALQEGVAEGEVDARGARSATGGAGMGGTGGGGGSRPGPGGKPGE